MPQKEQAEVKAFLEPWQVLNLVPGHHREWVDLEEERNAALLHFLSG